MVIDISTVGLWAGLLAVVGWTAWVYRVLRRLKAQCIGALSRLSAPMQRQHELVAQLGDQVRAQVDHERDLLDATAAASATVMAALDAALTEPSNTASLLTLGTAAAGLRSLLGPLRAVVETYPVLREDAAVSRLAGELALAGDEVDAARRAYNRAVAAFNGRAQRFPTLLLARMAGFGAATPLGETGVPR